MGKPLGRPNYPINKTRVQDWIERMSCLRLTVSDIYKSGSFSFNITSLWPKFRCESGFSPEDEKEVERVIKCMEKKLEKRFKRL